MIKSYLAPPRCCGVLLFFYQVLEVLSTFGVRQTDARTSPKSTVWRITVQPSIVCVWSPAEVASEIRDRVFFIHNAGASDSAHFCLDEEKSAKQTWVA